MIRKDTRDYGVDIARILAMFFVCVLHVGGWGCGKGMANAPTLVDRAVAVLFCSFAQVAVNLFMLITGYLGITRNWKAKSFWRLWRQVVFYCVGGVFVATLLSGESFPSAYVATLIFPIPFANGYWYFSAYAGAFFLFPYINKGFLALSPQEQKMLLVTLFVVICLFGCYNRSVWGGYNAVWLLVMYLTGAYFKLHPIAVKTRYLILFYCVGSLISGALFSADSFMRHTYNVSLPIPGMENTSPFIVCASLACFLICLHVKRISPLMQKILAMIAPLTFAVYLIHAHPIMSRYVVYFSEWFAGFSRYAWWHIPVVAMLIFVFCLVVDYLRICLFKGIGGIISRCKNGLLAQK